MPRPPLRSLLVIGGMLISVAHAAPPPCPSIERCSTLSCHLAAARCLLERGALQPVKDRLRPAVGEHPESVELTLLLARAYLGLGNRVWARRVLYQALQRHPNSCSIRAWIIWLHLELAELDQAQALLEQPGCLDQAHAGRWHLLSATLARHRRQLAREREELRAARRQKSLLPEDLELMAWLDAQANPDRRAPLDLKAELGVGYTSNGLASSPADLPSAGATTDQETGSPALMIDLLARFEPPWGRRLRPVVEGGLRGLVLLDDAVRDFSYYSFGIQPGVVLWSRLELSYHGQLFLLAGGDRYDPEGPRMYYESHRGEASWSATSWLSLWGGIGRSIFREAARTRLEADGGLGLAGRVWRLRLMGGLSLRTHAAEHEAYDLWGTTLLGTATMPVGPILLRARLVLGLDIHPTSASYFEIDEDRRDLLVRGGLELWSGSYHGIRGGLSYEVSHRDSTAGTYTYTDHRILARLRFNIQLDPWAPRRRDPPAGHVALPHGAGPGERGLQDERIQDLLRQEDAAQRGSSCIN